MKPLSLEMTPTRSRRLNEILGLGVLGVAVLLFPLLLLRLGVSWMRSRGLASPTAKSIGLLLWLVAAPTLLGLLPLHLRWRGALPVEGVAGRLMADAAVVQRTIPVPAW